MSGLYYTDMLDVLSLPDAGLPRTHHRRLADPGPQLGRVPVAAARRVVASHRLAITSPANDLSWMIDDCDDAPVGNMAHRPRRPLLADRRRRIELCRQGWPVHVLAWHCPLDSGNTRGWQIEVANNGVGEAWPQVQIDAYFTASNALNAHVGNQPGRRHHPSRYGHRTARSTRRSPAPSAARGNPTRSPRAAPGRWRTSATNASSGPGPVLRPAPAPHHRRKI